MDTQNPVPDPTAHGMARYDTDPDALAWARTRVQHQIDRLAAFEARAAETGKADLAHGLSVARRSTEQLLLGGEGCVVGAFDERRPVMFGGAAPTLTATTTVGSDPTVRLEAAATHLRTALAHPQLTAGPWLNMDDGDRLLRNQPGDEDTAPIYVVNEPMSNGANAAWIATMHPGVGEKIAALLETVAEQHFIEDVTQIYPAGPDSQTCGRCSLHDRDQPWPCPDVRATLALADAILAGTNQ